MMYRVSHLEAFRKWERDEAADTDALISQIKGGGVESEAMRAGTAFHRALEIAAAGTVADQIEAHGYTFQFDEDMRVELPDVRELRASKTFVVDGLPIEISGQVDAIDGKLIIDHKTTSCFDPDRYVAASQWKMYLDIFGANHFRWNVFTIKPRPKKPLVYRVKEAHTLEQFRYPGMEADCQRLVERFARFVRERA